MSSLVGLLLRRSIFDTLYGICFNVLLNVMYPEYDSRRIVALDMPEGFLLDPKLFKAYMDLFAAAYEKLANNEFVTCAFTKKEIKTVVSPDAVIMDVS